MKKLDIQRLQRYRRFYLPLIYGLATANFVAVIQLISAPQLNVRWKELTPEISALLPVLGFCGMTLMAANIPILLGFAVYTEIALRAGHYTKRPARALTCVAVLGMFGPGLAFFAFYPAFGIAYFVGMIGTLFAVDIAMGRFKIKGSN